MEHEYPYAELGFNMAIAEEAMETLGVTDRSHSLLSAGNSFDSKPLDATNTLRQMVDAANTLRQLVADTGTAVWRFPEDFSEKELSHRSKRTTTRKIEEEHLMNYDRIMQLAKTFQEMNKDAPEAYATFSQLSNFCIEIEPGDHQEQEGPLTIYEWAAAIYGNPDDLNKGNESEIAMNALSLDTNQASDLFFHSFTRIRTAGNVAMMLTHLALTGQVETNIDTLHRIQEYFQYLNTDNIRFMADFFEKELSTNSSLYNQRCWGESMFNNLEQYNETRKNFNCGTPACVAGWTTLLLGNHENLGSKNYYIGGEEINDVAGEVLGIQNDAHYDLFATNELDSKPEAVARTLRHLADTGTVVWQFPDDFPEGVTRE